MKKRRASWVLAAIIVYAAAFLGSCYQNWGCHVPTYVGTAGGDGEESAEEKNGGVSARVDYSKCPNAASVSAVTACLCLPDGTVAEGESEEEDHIRPRGGDGNTK